MPTWATIDMGTNTFQMLLAEITSPHALKKLRVEKRITRLGEGFSTEKRIRPQAAARAVSALLHFKTILAGVHVDDVWVMGTSAVREAVNQADFLAQVKHETGFDVCVISGEEEALCTFLGVNWVMENRAGPMVTIDIGGGSTELVVAEGSDARYLTSLPLGVVHLAETHLGDDPIRPAALAQMREQVDAALDTVASRLPVACRFAGTAGTITTLAAVEQRLAPYRAEKINHYALAVASVRRILKEMAVMTRAERMRVVGLESGREDILIAGSVILLRVMERFSYDPVWVSDCGVREGTLIRRFQNGRTAL